MLHISDTFQDPTGLNVVEFNPTIIRYVEGESPKSSKFKELDVTSGECIRPGQG